MTSSWLVALICMDRFVAVVLPLRAAVRCRKRCALVGICLIYVIIGTYNGVWVTHADRLVNGVCQPNTQPPGLVQRNRIFLIVGLSIYSFIPCVILITLTTLIIGRMYAARRVRRRLTMLQSTNAYDDRTSKTTLMLLCVIVAFVVLVMPIACAHLVFFMKGTPIFEAQEHSCIIFREVAALLEHMNYSINFYLYVVACPSFRHQLPRLFRCSGSSCRHGGSQGDLKIRDNDGSPEKTRSTATAQGHRSGLNDSPEAKHALTNNIASTLSITDVLGPSSNRHYVRNSVHYVEPPAVKKERCGVFSMEGSVEYLTSI